MNPKKFSRFTVVLCSVLFIGRYEVLPEGVPVPYQYGTCVSGASYAGVSTGTPDSKCILRRRGLVCYVHIRIFRYLLLHTGICF